MYDWIHRFGNDAVVPGDIITTERYSATFAHPVLFIERQFPD